MMNVFSRAAAGLTMVLAVTVSTGVDRFWALRDGDNHESKGDFSIDNDSSRLLSFATTDNDLPSALFEPMREKL